MNEYFNFVKDVGAPVAIALLVLYRLNGTLGKLRDSNFEVVKAVIKLTEIITIHEREEMESIRELRNVLDRLLERERK